MEAFATVEQYEARFGEVADKAMLVECLEDATAAVMAALDSAHIDYSEPDDRLACRMMRVTRSVANRIMPQDFGRVGVTQVSMTAGPYTEQVSYTPAYSTPKLLPSELDMLGVGNSAIGYIRPMMAGEHDD